MPIDKQLKKIFESLFETSGFQRDAIDKMTEELMSAWVLNSISRFTDKLPQESKIEFENLSKETTTPDVLSKLTSKLENDDRSRMLQILYEEGEKLTSRMIGKFNVKATPDQKEKFAKQLSLIIS